MPKCHRCNKGSFDGTRWKSYLFQSTHPEFENKYLCASCIQALNQEDRNQIKISYLNDAQSQETRKRCPNCFYEIPSSPFLISENGLEPSVYQLYRRYA